MDSGLLIAEFKGIIQPVDLTFLNPEYLHQDSTYLFVRLISDIVLFFSTATVTGFLSQRLRQSRNALETEIREREQIEEELRSLQLGESAGNGDSSLADLEMELVAINNDFWME